MILINRETKFLAGQNRKFAIHVRAETCEKYSMRHKTTFHTVGNKRHINGSIVQKQSSREGVKRSTPRFQRVNGLVQLQHTQCCAVIKAGVKWERPKFNRLVYGWRLVVLE